MVCLAPRGSAVPAGTRVPLGSVAGQDLFPPVQSGIFSWLPLPRTWVWGWVVISRLQLRLPCCGLASLLERACGSPSSALQTGVLVWVGVSLWKTLWGEILWKQNQVNLPVCSVGASGATLGTVRFVAVFSISEIRR